MEYPRNWKLSVLDNSCEIMKEMLLTGLRQESGACYVEEKSNLSDWLRRKETS